MNIDEIYTPAREEDDLEDGEEHDDNDQGEDGDRRMELVCRVSSYPPALVTWSRLTGVQPEIIPAYRQIIGSIERY